MAVKIKVHPKIDLNKWCTLVLLLLFLLMVILEGAGNLWNQLRLERYRVYRRVWSTNLQDSKSHPCGVERIPKLQLAYLLDGWETLSSSLAPHYIHIGNL